MGLREHTISEIVGIRQRDAHYHLTILETVGMVEEKDGLYYITKKGVEMLNLLGVTKKKIIALDKK